MDSKVKVGDWFLMSYGSDTHEWYILQESPTKVLIGQRCWCVSSAIWVPKDRVLDTGEKVGEGVLRWWWRFMPWRDIVTPVSYHK